MERKIYVNKFMCDLKLTTQYFVDDAIRKRKGSIENKNKTKFELKILLLFHIQDTLRNNFSNIQYDDILFYYTEGIIKDELVLTENININEFIKQRYKFHYEGIMEINNLENIKSFWPTPNDYTYLLDVVLFEKPLKNIQEIKNTTTINFLDAFDGFNKHLSSINLIGLTNKYKIKINNLSIKADKKKWSVKYNPWPKLLTTLTIILILTVILIKKC